MIHLDNKLFVIGCLLIAFLLAPGIALADAGDKTIKTVRLVSIYSLLATPERYQDKTVIFNGVFADSTNEDLVNIFVNTESYKMGIGTNSVLAFITDEIRNSINFSESRGDFVVVRGTVEIVDSYLWIGHRFRIRVDSISKLMGVEIEK